MAHVEAVAYAENAILCYVSSAGDIIYSDRECPDGYFLVNGMLELSTVPSRAKEAYAPIVPVESTVDVAPLFSEAPAVETKKETIIYYDENGNLTMVLHMVGSGDISIVGIMDCIGADLLSAAAIPVVRVAWAAPDFCPGHSYAAIDRLSSTDSPVCNVGKKFVGCKGIDFNLWNILLSLAMSVFFWLRLLRLPSCR